MRRNIVLGGLLLIVTSMALGATLFREDVAQAAAAILNVREQNVDANGNIKVHEQGTATVSVSNTVTTDDKFAPGKEPARFGPVPLDLTGSFTPVVPEVPAGKMFIVTYLNVSGERPDVSGVVCVLQLRTSELLQTLGGLPVEVNRNLTVASEDVFIPLKAGEGLNIACGGTTFAVALAAGYFVPAT